MLKRLAVLALFVLMLGSLMFGQQSNAKIIGTVTDSEGNPLPGVSVEATSPKMVGKATTITDENGTFRLLALQPGDYKLVYSLEGFMTKVQENVLLTIEQTINLKVTMQMGKIEEYVTVKGAPLIDIKSGAKGMTLTKDVFTALPKGRNFDTLIAIIPGVANENLLRGISVDGASGGENVFYVDGTNVTNVFGGTRFQDASFEFVDEVQIKASGYQAEFGGSLGGVINVVTRSGGNEFHGEAFAYYSGNDPIGLTGTERDQRILHPNITKPTEYFFNYADRGQEQKFHTADLGFGLGGYIVKDKVWFYGNFQPVFTSTTSPVVFLNPDKSIHQACDPLTFAGPKYEYSQDNNALNFQLKLTTQLIKDLRLSASIVNNYTYYNGGLPARDGSSSDSIDWPNMGFKYPNWSGNISADYTLGNNAMISLRTGYFYSNTVPNGKITNPNKDPLYLFSGTNTGLPGVTETHASGWQNTVVQAMFSPDYKVLQNHFTVNGDFSYFLNFAGEHALKTGFQYERVESDRNTLYIAPFIQFLWNQGGGKYGYADVRGGVDSLDGPYGKQYGEFGDAVSNRWALYLQDSWTIANRLTLNLGVRAESENVPSFNTDSVNWKDYVGADAINFPLSKKIAPRLGFIWDVKGDSSLKFYTNFGIYYNTMQMDMALGSFGGMRWISSYYKLDDPNSWKDFGKLQADGTRYYPTSKWYGATDYRSQSWGSVDPNIMPMSEMELTAGIEKRLSNNLSLSVRGVWKALLKTIDDVGVFIVDPNDPEVYNEHYYITNPGYGYARPISEGGKFDNNFWPTPKAKRDYKAINIELTKRLSNNWMGGVNLTISRLWGNYTGIVSSDEPTAAGYGRADGNVTRYFDMWWISYDASGKQQPQTGLLPTDRPIILKVYGSYHFPFGLTLGMVANYMRGTPITTMFNINNSAGYYVYGRGDLGRTPDLYFINLSAEYNLKIGKNTLQFNANIDNATNNDVALFYARILNYGNMRWNRLGYSVITPEPVKTGYDPKVWEETTWPLSNSNTKFYRHPLYDKDTVWYQPISARIGVRFIF